MGDETKPLSIEPLPDDAAERDAKIVAEKRWRYRHPVIDSELFRQGEVLAKLATELARQRNLRPTQSDKLTLPREMLPEAWELVREACRVVSVDEVPPVEFCKTRIGIDEFLDYGHLISPKMRKAFGQLCNPKGGTLPPIKLEDGTNFHWRVYKDEDSFKDLVKSHAARLKAEGILEIEPEKFVESFFAQGKKDGFHNLEFLAMAETRHLMIQDKGKGRRGARETSAPQGGSSKRTRKSSRKKV